MALLARWVLDCVVAIGVPTGKEQVEWIASGFLYGDFFKKGKGETIYRVYLITNRHVFKGLKQVLLRFNPSGREAAKTYSLHLVDESSKKERWVPHPNPDIDIAVIGINIKLLREHKIQVAYFQSDQQQVATLDAIAKLGITEGDFVYALGFPMGLIGPERNYVIVRSGVIAKIQDAIDRRSNEFLIDSFIFPGNSGGPVVTKPEAIALHETKAVSAAYLIGVIQSYVPYQDFAISQQTKRPRVIFEENSGLTAVIPIDFVKEAIKVHKETIGKGLQP